MKNRILNFRPLFIIFIFTMLGILLGGVLFANNKINIGIILLLGITLLTTILFGLYIFKKLTREKLKHILLILFSMIFGISLIFSSLGFKLSKTKEYDFLDFKDGKITATVYGRVENLIDKDEKQSLILSNIKINENNVKNAKIYIYLLENNEIFENLSLGKYLKLTATIYESDVSFKNKPSTSLFIDNIYFNGYGYSDFEISDGKTTIFENIQIETEKDLKSYVEKDNIEIFKALLLGNKTSLDSETYSYFSKAGIAHILAISGLHVGFIVLMLLFVLKKFKIKPLLQFVITFIVLLLYCFICGFNASVVRASLMSLCLLLSKLLGERDDKLSSLSLAGIILLISNPVYLFDIGFELSFGAVFGILFFYKPIKNLLLKIKLPDFIASSFSITISSQLLILPIIANCFGFLAPIGLLSNLIILPLFAIYFSALFIVFILNIFLPLGILYIPFSYLMTVLVNFTMILSKARLIDLIEFDLLSMIIYYVSLFLISQFIMIKLQAKLSIMLCCITAFCPIFILNNAPTTFNSYTLSTISETSSYLITTKDDYRALICLENETTYSFNILNNFLHKQKVNHIDTILLPQYSDEIQNNLCEFCKNYKITKMILPENLKEATLLGLVNNIYDTSIIYQDNFKNIIVDAKISLKFHYNSNKLRAVELFSENENILILNSITEYQFNSIKDELDKNYNKILVEKINNDTNNILTSLFHINQNIIVKDLYNNSKLDLVINLLNLKKDKIYYVKI